MSSSLLQLPAEIRNRIYDFVFEKSHVRVHTKWVPALSLQDFTISGHKARRQFNFVRSCRQIYTETLDLWYQVVTLEIRNASMLLAWVDMLPKARKRLVQKVEFTQHLYGLGDIYEFLTTSGAPNMSPGWQALFKVCRKLPALQLITFYVFHDLGYERTEFEGNKLATYLTMRFKRSINVQTK
ncbi:hypothetical protein EJ07DRAFT_177350 [Lizonia empirigonia]|nr:hypothetical protein EJ07DRAFT_177350 [Lizonia empirigonia]